MSDLWLARDERAESTVALKFLKTELAAQTAYRELFHKEWRIGSRLMHAHIARVFEYSDADDGPYFALQYINGPDISVLANENLSNALRPFGLLSDALRYAHGKGYVHRDLKASNVLLDQRGAPYLSDFGIAAAESGGSAANASPAQKDGQPPAPADDVYAFGVLLHEIITSQPPAEGLPVGQLARPSGEVVPDGVQDLVRRMLANDADARPAAAEIADQLQAAGFPPGPASLPAQYRSAEPVADDVQVESIRPLHKARTARPTESRAEARQTGVSAKLVYWGLGVLLTLFIGVIFILPDRVEQSRQVAPQAPVAEEGEADPTALPDVDEDATEDARPDLGLDGDSAGFSENLGQTSGNEAVRVKLAADEALGDLLSQLERLKYRGVERWGGQGYLDALDVYAEGDAAYLAKNYQTAGDRYRRATSMLEPFFGRIDSEFDKAMIEAAAAFERRDFDEAIRLYDLAVAITPGSEVAEKGLTRARNLEAVLDLMEQGRQFRDELELDAARLAFQKALDLDPEWQPAQAALDQIGLEIKQYSFEMRMTEALEALAVGDFDSARAAFNAAKTINPDSREPTDGLLQVDQEVRLLRIRQMESEAFSLESGEQWEAAVATYEALLEVDGDLQFAKEGLSRSSARAGVHRKLQGFIDDPDTLSRPGTMQQATQLLLDVSRMDPMGPRLTDQKDELSRLLKRAATPLTVQFVSDNATEVSIFRVGKLGHFATRDLSLRPGNYVAVGSRPGFRDVRLEFRVAPEIESTPIVVRCEEPI